MRAALKPDAVDFRSVMAARKAGRHEEALAGARELMKRDDKNIWHHRALGWCLVSCAWDALKSRRLEEAGRLVAEARLGVDPGEELLNNALKKLESAVHNPTREILGKLKTLAGRLKEENGDPPADAEIVAREATPLLRQYAEVPNVREASLTHSLVLLYAARTVGNSPVFLSFARWWNLDLLREEDFQRYEMKGLERPLPSLCERVLKALNLSRQAMGPEAREHIGWILAFFELHASRFADNPWIAYYHGLLLVEAGRSEQACRILLPFVKLHSRDAWAWGALARAYGNQPALAAACLCRALECPAKGPEFLLKIRASLARTWIRLEQPGAAAIEAEAVGSVRLKNGWSVDPELEALASTGATRPDAGDYAALCAGYARRAAEWVTPFNTCGVAARINEQKGLLVIAIGPGREALARMSLVSGAGKVRPGDCVDLALADAGDPDRPPHVVALRPAAGGAPDTFCKVVSGIFKPHPAGFGFVGDVFVSPDLVGPLTAGQKLEGLAVLARKRREHSELGWKMVKLHSLSGPHADSPTEKM